MFEQFKEWVALTVPASTYAFSRGMWQDGPEVAQQWFCALLQMPGAAPDVDDRRPRYRVLLLGPRNGREHAGAIQATAEALAQAALGDIAPCGAASVRAIGEPVGPGYTAENRPWYSVDFQVLF
ncbi:phage tail termination protein [Achromobacter denitrificans]|uniref:phage tail termination protein n=1 Tax=Achromobacter denitrificans TaxID=32002 RepID=UPI000F65E4D5|nr:hypothetical protein [Achromobacter denitrificans]RSE88594.1 hypothetical protein EGU64_05060 [Achromobacter denitrificans]